MSEKKIQVSIYKINKECELLSKSENIFSSFSKHIKDKGFSPQKLESNLNKNYQINLFYRKNPLEPKWKNFLQGIAESNQNIFKKKQSWSESFIMLLLNNSSKNLYATSGGLGYNVIQEFIDDDFGLDILSRLISKEERILKSVKEKSVVGGILGATKFFRKDYNLFENDGFGKIYQELKSRFNKKILIDKFGFSDEDLKKDSSCIAKTSFKINKSITFNQMLQIINGCENIYNDETLKPISINNVEKIIKKKSTNLIENLEKELFNQLWNKFSTKKDSYDFDICHKDFEKYLTASKYVIKKNDSHNNFLKDFEFSYLKSIDELFEKIKETSDKPTNESDFSNLIKSLKILSYNEEDKNNPLTKGAVIHHLFGDVYFEDKKYFLIDNSWYKIKDEFIDDLNKSCENFINKNYDKNLSKTWNYPKEEENDFNVKFISDNLKNDKTLVLDKITPENIEPCDILKWDDENLYFFHVKAGFNNAMRDLCSQVFISANKINNDSKSSKIYIGKIYDELKNKKDSSNDYFKKIGNQTDNITKDDFLHLFEKKLVFILSVLDTGKDRDLKTNLTNFRSNIAKFSLQELVKGMKGIDVELKFTQVFKIKK